MLDPGILWGKERKDKIDWLSVDCVEIHGLFQPEEDTDDTIQPFQPCMRKRNTVPDAGRPKAFAFLQRIDGAGPAQTIDGLGDLTQILKQTLLAGCVTKDPDSGRIQKAR